VLDDPQAARLSKEKIDQAWAYAYRFFFDFPLPFPYHLVHLWDDYRDMPLKDVFNSRNWKKFANIFEYLAGKPLDWSAVKGGK
jgi:hypothetical protein